MHSHGYMGAHACSLHNLVTSKIQQNQNAMTTTPQTQKTVIINQLAISASNVVANAHNAILNGIASNPIRNTPAITAEEVVAALGADAVAKIEAAFTALS